MVQRAVNVKIKISLKSSIMVWDLDAHYQKSSCLSYITFSKVQTQESSTKKSKAKEPKTNNLKPTPLRNNLAKPAKMKNKKDKKKKVLRAKTSVE